MILFYFKRSLIRKNIIMAGFKSVFSRVPKHSKFHYESRYGKEEKGLENRKKSIKLEKGAFFKHSKTFSKFKRQ